VSLALFIKFILFRKKKNFPNLNYRVPVVELREREREIKPKNKITHCDSAKATPQLFGDRQTGVVSHRLTLAAAAALTSRLLLPAKPSPHSVTLAAGAGQWTSTQKFQIWFAFFFSSLILFLSTCYFVNSLVTFSLSIH
jgi:hypothetical protein